MKILFFCTFIAAVALSSSALAEATNEAKAIFPHGTPDGRFGTTCSLNSSATDEPVCSVPFARLIAMPEKYDGKIISVVGFLIDDHGLTMLFPSQESFRAKTLFDYVYVRDGISPTLKPKLREGIWVHVVGKFDAKYISLMCLGAIWHAASVEERVGIPERVAPPTPDFPKL